MGEEDNTVLQQFMLAFGLGDNDIYQSKIFRKKPKLEQAHGGSNDHSKSSDEKWKFMKFDHFSKETPHDIKTVLKEEQKDLLAAKNDIIEQRLQFYQVFPWG